MRRLKRFVAGIMCACMMFSGGGFTSMAADIGIETGIEKEDTASASDASALIEATSEETDQELDNQGTEDSVKEAPLLHYMMIENDYVSVPDSQYVLVNFGDEPLCIDSAAINYTNKTTGVSYRQDVADITETSVYFNMEFNDESLAGEYEIVSVEVSVDGESFTITMEQAGIEAKFGVNTEVSVTPEAWIMTEEEADAADALSDDNSDDEGIIISDAQGNELSVAELQDAIGSDNQAALDNQGASKTVIIIDPGHGGSDSGATRTYDGVTYAEREINLKIAKACKAALDKYSSAEVYLTRSDNSTYLSLADRCQFGAEKRADILVSIHINAASNTSAHGAEVLIPSTNYLPETNKIAEGISEKILAELSALGISNRGTVIRYSDSMPIEDYPQYHNPDGSRGDYYGIVRECKRRGYTGIIIEHAFISNESEVKNYLSSDAKLQALGEADARAIASYYNLSNEDLRFNASDGKWYYYNDGVLDTTYTGLVDNEYGTWYAVKGVVDFTFSGLATVDGKTYYIKSNRLDTEFTGFYKQDGKQYYIEKGVVAANGKEIRYIDKTWYYLNNGYIDTVYDGICHNVNGWWKITNGKVDFNFNGLAYNEYGWWYCKNGKVDFTHVGVENNKYGWWYVKNGKVDRSYTGIKNNANGWWKITNGKVDFSYTGLECNENGWWYCKNGKVDFAYNGMAENKYGWWYCKKGKVDFTHTGVENNKYGWWYFKNGRIDFTYNGIASNAYGSWKINKGRVDFTYNGLAISGKEYFYVKNGKVDTSYTGMVYYNEIWMYVKNGKVDPTFEGLGKNSHGSFYYKNGTIAWNYTGVVYGDGAWWYVAKGKVDTGYTGIGTNSNGSWYIKNGKVDFTYTGIYESAGKRYYVVNGKADTSGASVAIMGTTNTTVAQMVKYFNAVTNKSYPQFYTITDAPTIEDFCRIYVEECNAEGIRAEVAFCQAMKETGFLKFGGQVSISQFNFAGLGATDGGTGGASFGSVRDGIRAQVQHLKAYASTEPLKNTCVDGRFSLVKRGCAPYVEWLGIKENPYGRGWATSKGYGYSIINDYMAVLFKY